MKAYLKWHLLNGRFNQQGQSQRGDHGFRHWFSTQNDTLPNHKDPVNFIRNVLETTDLVNTEPARLAKMKKLLTEFYDEVRKESPTWPEWTFQRHEGQRIIWPPYRNRRKSRVWAPKDERLSSLPNLPPGAFRFSFETALSLGAADSFAIGANGSIHLRPFKNGVGEFSVGQVGAAQVSAG